MNIVLVGPPASGKGTQAKMLAKKYNLVHISTGDLLRNIVMQKGELANEIRALIDNGNFVSDELITKLLKQHLQSINHKNGILLDGYPRTLEQAKALNEFLPLDLVVELSLSCETLVNRVLDRICCPKCGKSFLISQYGCDVCDVCQTKLEKRKDDTAPIAKARFDEYIKKTYPIVEFYKDFKGFYRVDSEVSIPEVYEKICEIVDKNL